ncbi:MAG: YutD family protein [Bacilli bacterium]|nr:YutD family protein [Bacilli bacterium]
MMKKVVINNINYEILENKNKCFDLDEIQKKLEDIDYFLDFDYIFGDYSYDKVRLKGFNDNKNEKCTEINDINQLENYKNNYCSYGSDTFLLKKID